MQSIANPIIILYLDSPKPLALAVFEAGACGDCGANLNERLVSIFHRDAGILCVDCAEVRRGRLERCTDCGAYIQLGPEGIRLIAGGVALHDCPRAELDVYALATQIWERRQWEQKVRAA